MVTDKFIRAPKEIAQLAMNLVSEWVEFGIKHSDHPEVEPDHSLEALWAKELCSYFQTLLNESRKDGDPVLMVQFESINDAARIIESHAVLSPQKTQEQTDVSETKNT